MSYSKKMNFTEEPDYEYLKNLFKQMADREGIDLNDKVFDWSVKAITIQCFPQFYDFFKTFVFSPFNKYGRFEHVSVDDKQNNDTQNEIISMAPYFKFHASPKQLLNLRDSNKVKKLYKSEKKRLLKHMK